MTKPTVLHTARESPPSLRQEIELWPLLEGVTLHTFVFDTALCLLSLSGQSIKEPGPGSASCSNGRTNCPSKGWLEPGSWRGWSRGTPTPHTLHPFLTQHVLQLWKRGRKIKVELWLMFFLFTHTSSIWEEKVVGIGPIRSQVQIIGCSVHG